MEAENRRILEFLSHKEHKEENRMAKIKERETAKDLLLKTVETLSLCPQFYLFIELFIAYFWHQKSLFSVVLQLSENIEGERQQREEFDRVCVELYVEEKEEANRQREIVSSQQIWPQ